MPEGFTAGEISWTVEDTPGHSVTLYGTAQSVHGQLLALNPDYDEQMGTLDARAAEGDKLNSAEVLDVLAKRDHNNCWVPAYHYAQRPPIVEGIKYLRGLKGVAGNDAWRCGQISCSYDSVIEWCNNNNFRKTIGWNDLANAAQVIVNKCSSGSTTMGERIHDDGILVRVRRGQC